MAAIYESQVDIRGQGHRVFYGTGIPSASDAGGVPFNVGDMIINTAPVQGIGSPDRWICIAAGKPGTWQAIMSGDQYLSLTIPNAQVLTLFSVPLVLLAAQGAGTLIDVSYLILENVFLTGAYAAGGTIAVYYGADATGVLASATVAATFLTSPVANQSIKAGGALASNLSSAVLNTGIVLAVASADFTTGAGSLKLRLGYRVHTGL